MAKIEETITFQGASADDLYQAGKTAYGKAGWQIWKERSIAWLLLAKRIENGIEINSNISARFGSPAPMTIIVSADALSEEQLRPYYDQLVQAVKAILPG